MNKKSTRRALLTSIVSLVLCCTMLIGTTFAWFTDTVTSAGNKIQAGNLDIELYMWNSKTSSEKISERTEPIFGTGALATNSTNTLWEPGKTQTVYFSLKNEGSLDLKYKVDLLVKNVAKDLYKVMEYAITPDAKFGEVTSWTSGKGVEVGVNATDANNVSLKAGGEHFFALSVHMKEEATNEYMDGKVEFDINVLAGQLSSESDSFGAGYDVNAAYPGIGFAPLPEAGESAKEIPVQNKEGQKVGTVVIPAGAIAEGVTQLEASIDDDCDYVGNFTVNANLETLVFDVKVPGLKEGNTIPVKAELRIPAGLDPATVALYHYDTLIESTYDPVKGLVKFESATFSPFTVVYDKESVYVPPVIGEGTDHPNAKVVESPEYVNKNLPWGSYGQWSPTEGLDANLEAAYTFTCGETLEEAKDNPYANWYCDFYVKLDQDLGENQIFLGGNYGSFGWVGFHNGDLTLEANTEIGLLKSVTTNPWTYLDVVQYVKEFICGVGDVDNALSGATFTVMLRLTNPEDATDFVNVKTIDYTFN